MPPINFITKVNGTFVGAVISFAVPASTRPGDLMIAVVDAIGPTAYEADNPGNAQWFNAEPANASGAGIASVGAGAGVLYVFARIAKTSDTGTVTITADTPITNQRSTLLIYRQANNPHSAADDADPNIGPGIRPLEWSATTNAVATAHSVPSRTLISYSDIYIGIVVITSASTGVVPPAGCTERDEIGGAGRQLEIFDFLPEAPGATGVKVATTGGGFNSSTLSLIYAAGGLITPRAIDLVAPGAIGLPTEGI